MHKHIERLYIQIRRYTVTNTRIILYPGFLCCKGGASNLRIFEQQAIIPPDANTLADCLKQQ